MASSIVTAGRSIARGFRGAVAALSGRSFASMSARDVYRWFTRSGGASSVTAPMAQNTWVYSAVSVIARTVCSLDWRIVREDDKDAASVDGPARELIANPAPGVTSQDLFEEIAGHLVEGGEAHVLDASMQPRPSELLVIGRRQMEPYFRPGTDMLLWWEVRPTGAAPVAIPPDATHAYIRLFNPYDAWRGLSPFQACALGVSQDYQAAVYNEAALRNGGSPGGLYIANERLSQEEKEEFLAVIRQHHEGAKNANKPLVLGGAWDYKTTAFASAPAAGPEASERGARGGRRQGFRVADLRGEVGRGTDRAPRAARAGAGAAALAFDGPLVLPPDDRSDPARQAALSEVL